MADHTGIYKIEGTMLTAINVPSSVAPDINLHVSGSVTDVVPGQSTLITLGNEVVCHNAFLSGVEHIDNFATRELYYSKQNRLSYALRKRVPTMYDVYLNIPTLAPSASALVAASYSLPAYMAEIGSLNSTAASGTSQLASLSITMRADMIAASGTAYTDSVFNAAVSGNIMLVVSGGYSTSIAVTDAPVLAPSNISVYSPAGYSSRSVDFTSGTVYMLSWVPLSSSISGVFSNRSYYNPSSFNMAIQDAGIIRDLRAWVELVHDTRTASDIVSYSGLKTLQIAIRSPNTDFHSAHPLWNSAGTIGLPIRTLPAYNSTVPELLRNSYLLWAGHNAEVGVSDSLVQTNKYHEFDNDIDMRTVFWDGSNNRNPRDLTVLFPSASSRSPQNPLSYTQLLNGNYPSPTSGALTVGLTGALNHSLTCSSVPWMLDGRLVQGVLGNTTSSLTGAAYVPSTWAPTEPTDFVTMGATLGPQNVRPVYPILDDVYAFKATDDTISGSFSISGHGPILGFRPGLRGTEVSGTWSFLVANSTSSTFSGVWVRQFRLEMIIDSGVGLFEFTPSRARKWSKSSLVPGVDGFQNLAIVSGAAAWDVGLSLIQRSQAQDYGRTVSITDQKYAASYAVISCITGSPENFGVQRISSSLYGRLSEIGILSPIWFLGGSGFGTPYIPETSWSIGGGGDSEIDAEESKRTWQELIGKTTLIPSDNTSDAYMKRESPPQTTTQIAESMTSGSA